MKAEELGFLDYCFKNILVKMHTYSMQYINLSLTSVLFLSFFLFCNPIVTFLIPRHSIK